MKPCAVIGGDAFAGVLGSLGVPCARTLDGAGSAIVLAGTDLVALERFVRGGGSAYVECLTGGFLPRALGEPRVANFERIHTAGPSQITARFEPLTILDEHGSMTVPVEVPAGAVEVLSYGKVAGTHTAVFGPAAESWPALLDIPVGAGRLLWASTALSNHERGRFAPAARWRALIRALLASLTGADPAQEPALVTSPRVWAASGTPVTLRYTGPAPTPDLTPGPSGEFHSQPLHLPDGEHHFTIGGASATITVGPREERYRRMVDRGIAWFDGAGMFFDQPDGTAGVAEGLSNELGADGVHPFRPQHRGDGFVQVAHAFARYAELTGQERPKRIAANLMRLVLDRMQITDRNALYGSWEPRGARRDLTGTSNLFADDNGWMSLFALAHGALPEGLRGTEALVRTTRDGLQTDPWRTPSTLLSLGWAGVADLPLTEGLDLSSHWNSSAQSAMLYAYGVTGELRYLETALAGLDHMCAEFPRARLETSRTCEAIRFLFPLTGAYHYTREPRYLETMLRIAAYLKEHQDPASGAIAEWDGRCPTSNEGYGVDEASIFQANGDPVTDQLYGTGFAAMTLPVAHRVTGEPIFAELATGVLDYLSRIQLDEGDPLLDGAWMRAFDYRAWEYFGSNCDIGWGPYCVETGWSVAPALIGAMLQLSGDPFFPDVTSRPGLAAGIVAEFDAIAEGVPYQEAFVRGGDGRITRGASAVVGDLVAAGDPVTVRNPSGEAVEVYVRGADGRLHHTYLHDRLGLGAWRQVGDVELAGDPSVAYNEAAGTVEVYALGVDGRVHHTSMIDVRAGHTPWEIVGKLYFSGDPTVVYRPDLATVEITATAADGSVCRTTRRNLDHRPWTPAGSSITHIPWNVA